MRVGTDFSYRNQHIFFAAIEGKKKSADLARCYKLSPPRIKQIVLKEAKRRAPKLYYELIAIRYYYCDKSNISHGPSIFELRKFKDIFLFGDI